MKNLSYQKRILLGFCVATALLCMAAFSVYVSFAEMKHHKQRVEHTYEVISALQEILSDLKDVQSSVRGYAITGMTNYLTPYYVSIPKLNDALEKLAGLITDNPTQLERMSLLQKDVALRLQIAEDTLNLYKTKGQQATFDQIRKGTGKSTMDEIRVIVADMMSEEQKLLAERRTAVEASSRLIIAAGVLGLITCLCILIFMFSLISRETKRRTQTEENLRKAFADMEQINSETQLIGRLGDYLRSCRSEHEAYEIIANNIPVIFPATYGSISMFSNSRNLLQRVLTWGNGPAMDPDFEPDQCWALRQGRIHQVKPDGRAPLCDHLRDTDGKTPSICVPMQAQGETIGQLYIAAAEQATIDGHHLITLRTVAEQISLALANLSLQRILREQSIKDPLTKVFNRRYLEETLKRECIRAERNKQSLSLLMMDIDHFKKVNDTYGHDAGDAVLVAFAALLMEKSRKDDIVCRLGGEEFVIAMPTAQIDMAMKRAQEICDATRRLKISFQNQTIPITVSIGVAVFPDHGKLAEDVLHNADDALYEAKHGGRDRAIAFEKSGEEAA